jgi:hypothetical protein
MAGSATIIISNQGDIKQTQTVCHYMKIKNNDRLASYLSPCHVLCVLSLLLLLTFVVPSPYVFSFSPLLSALSLPLSSYAHVLTSEITIHSYKIMSTVET